MVLPKITVVVPSFNQGQYLEETLLSVINQGYANLELFVVDGASVDNSVEIIKKYQNNITWWISEPDKGQSDAINKGLVKATGEIITWLNSDDLLTPNSLFSVSQHFSQLAEDVGLIHGGTILFDAKRQLKTDWGYHPSLERNLAGMAFPQPSAFFLKEYLDKVGGKLNNQFHYGMDYDLFCRLACVCRFVPVRDIFSKYRLHDNSKSVRDQDKFIGDWNRVFVNLCKHLDWNDVLGEIKSSEFFSEEALVFYYPLNFIPEKTFLTTADKEMIIFYHYCYMLKAFYWSNQREKARELLKYILKQYPDVWIKNEKDIQPIMNKLALPDGLLRLLKRIKNYL